jgi:hypothetical protein
MQSSSKIRLSADTLRKLLDGNDLLLQQNFVPALT